MRAEILSHFAESVHEACYQVAAKDNGYPLLGFKEGASFRNCVTKFQVQYATLRQNLRDSEFQYLR